MPEPSSSAGSASTTKPTPPDGAPCQRARAGTLRGSPCQAASRLLRFAAPLRVTRRPAQRRVCRWPEAGFRPPATRNPHPALTPAQTQTTVTNFTAFPTRNPSSEACAFRLISLLEWTVPYGTSCSGSGHFGLDPCLKMLCTSPGCGSFSTERLEGWRAWSRGVLRRRSTTRRGRWMLVGDGLALAGFVLGARVKSRPRRRDPRR